MNKSLHSLLSASALASALLLLPAIALAVNGPGFDPVARMLTVSGTVPVKDAGPYVHLGSYRIHVWTMLGRPSSILRDGTWLYQHFSAQASAAQGTLVVRFDQGQVSQLSLVSTAVATAMLSSPAPEPAAALISRR